MSQVKIINGDLYIVFNEYQDDVLISYRLDNGAEIDFNNNEELVQLVLPNFETQLNRGSLSNVDIDLIDFQINNNKIILSIKIINDTINITVDCSSLRNI